MRSSRGALLVAALLVSVPAWASGLIDNVNGITTDAQGQVVRFNGLLLDRDGRVERRLAEREKRPKQLDYRYDGKGRTLIPGFVDARADLSALAVAQLSLDLTAAASTDDSVVRVRAYIAANAGRRWILGFGWDDSRWDATRPPRTADLDALGLNAPIWLVDADGLRGWGNSVALRQAGVTPPRDGAPLTGDAFAKVASIVPPPAPKDLDAAFLKAQRLLIERGITAVGDVGTNIAAWQSYRRAGDRGALRLRIVGYAADIAELALVAGPAPTPWLYDGRLKLAGLALAIDGSLSARAAWVSEPYANSTALTPQPLLHDTALRNRMSRAAMDGFATVLHAEGDRAVAEATAAIAEIAGSYSGRAHWRVDGAALGNPPASGLDAIVVAPAAIADGGAMARARLGAAADSGAYGWATLLAGGNALAFMGRGRFQPLVPFAAMRITITREGPDGQPFGGWRPDERLRFGAALRAATAGGAAALGASGQFGTLAPGELADFLLIDRDIELTRPADLAATRISEIWMAGSRVRFDEATAPADQGRAVSTGR